MTVEIEVILRSEDLLALLEAAEANGQLRQTELQEVLEPLELDPLETDAVYIELDRRGIELVDETERELPPPPPPTAHKPCDLALVLRRCLRGSDLPQGPMSV